MLGSRRRHKGRQSRGAGTLAAVKRKPSRPPPHPGQVLVHRFLRPRGIMQAHFAAAIGMAESNLSALIAGRRALTPWMAWAFARVLRTKPEYWMKLQGDYELWWARPGRGARERPRKPQRR